MNPSRVFLISILFHIRMDCCAGHPEAEQALLGQTLIHLLVMFRFLLQIGWFRRDPAQVCRAPSQWGSLRAPFSRDSIPAPQRGQAGVPSIMRPASSKGAAQTRRRRFCFCFHPAGPQQCAEPRAGATPGQPAGSGLSGGNPPLSLLCVVGRLCEPLFSLLRGKQFTGGSGRQAGV